MEIGRAAVIALLMTAAVQGGDVTIEKNVRLSPARPGGDARPLPPARGPRRPPGSDRAS